MESETQLIANKSAYADAWKREKIDNISLMLNAAIAAQGRVGLMMNAQKNDLDAVLNVLPALNSPTISQLRNPAWVAPQHHPRRNPRPRCNPQTQARRSHGHRRIPIKQSRHLDPQLCVAITMTPSCLRRRWRICFSHLLLSLPVLSRHSERSEESRCPLRSPEPLELFGHLPSFD